jgi:hypothetical protein
MTLYSNEGHATWFALEVLRGEQCANDAKECGTRFIHCGERRLVRVFIRAEIVWIVRGNKETAQPMRTGWTVLVFSNRSHHERERV